MEIDGADLTATAERTSITLLAHAGENWDARAGDLEWSCRFTADHISDALMFYAVQLATRATGRVARIRVPQSEGAPDELAGAIVSAAAFEVVPLLESLPLARSALRA